MNIKAVAEQDLAITLEDSENGFGVAFSIKGPCGTIIPDIVGQTGDIHFLIDPDTGQAISGRVAHVSLRIASLAAGGLGLPEAVNNSSGKPWVFTVGVATFTVREARPDRTLGIVTVILEAYDAC